MTSPKSFNFMIRHCVHCEIKSGSQTSTVDEASGYGEQNVNPYTYGYASGGGGGGGGGGGSAPTEQQLAAANANEAVYKWKQGGIVNKTKNADKAYKAADESSKNNMEFQKANAEKNAGNEWFTNLQKLQDVVSQQKSKMGNALYGSGFQDLADLTSKIDDRQDVAALNSLNESWDDIESDYWKALAQTNNARNEFYLDAEDDLYDLVGEYASQMISMNPELINGGEDSIGKYYDPDSKTLIAPDWLKEYEGFFDKHFKGAINPTRRAPTIRGANANQKAWDKGLTPLSSSPSQSTTKSYWERVLGGYQNRK